MRSHFPGRLETKIVFPRFLKVLKSYDMRTVKVQGLMSTRPGRVSLVKFLSSMSA